MGARPALPYSLISNISSNGVRGNDGILEVEYGEYPQQAASEYMQTTLTNVYQTGMLIKTGKEYTTDSRKYDDYDLPFLENKYEEYEYQGKKYVRVEANSYYDGDKFTLSNGKEYSDGDYVWVEVSPIKWLVDEKANVAVTKKLIFSGVQFNRESNYKGDFYKTDIKKFMDNYLSKEIIGSKVDTKSNMVSKEQTTSRKQNPYNFVFDNVSEEEIIKGAVESGVSVFLHGQSSEGKSARVKQLDPDCEIIYLRNATPDSLNGKSVYNSETGEMIDVPPTWFKKVLEKCKSEPDKIHIVFFDEITNALPAIQGVAYNIILDREVNGIWKLPDNARIVAAGNDLNDSLAANALAEPLFNRFAHVYIKTTVESWLEWAATPSKEYQRLDYKEPVEEHKIHPSIYAFIASRREAVLRSKYTGDKPNADPRKWEMASKVLYRTKNPEMLRALVGEEITRDFVAFCNQPVITLKDVIEENYTDADLNMNISEKCATVVGLTLVDDENLEKVRKFVLKLGPELCAIFDSLWTHGDLKRLERIEELRLENSHVGGMKI